MKRTEQLKDSVLEFFFSYLLQVCFLGAVGLTCWIAKAPISAYWAAIGPKMATSPNTLPGSQRSILLAAFPQCF